jgi:hypothetical protein
MITDVDAVIRCREDITNLIAEVGADHGLESNWLNNDVKAFVSPVVDDPEPIEIAVVGESHVTAASLRVLAAMKIRAGRPGIDRPDLAFLLEKLEVKDEAEAVGLFEWYFPEDPLRYSALTVVQTLLAERAASDPGSPEADLP